MTSDDIPQYSEFYDGQVQKCSQLVGKMQKLYVGSEYKVEAKCEYNEKFSNYQYTPIKIIATKPKNKENQELFVKTLTSQKIATLLLEKFPNIIEDVMKGNVDDNEVIKIKGLGEKSWLKIKNAIIDNYVISDIISMLQPLGVTYNLIKKLLLNEPNPELLKQKLEKNPYMMTKIKGLGFKKVDDLALKIKPELKSSVYRTQAFVNYYLQQVGDNDGHTWIYENELKKIISDTIPECIHYIDDVFSNSLLLYRENNKIGLLYYKDVEEKIYSILKHKNNEISSFIEFNDNEIESSIKTAEREQGFEYNDEQLFVIKNILKSNLSILSGKAGVGKTSIIRAVLLAYKQKGYKISPCALSAKAAQRITEATNYDATTIHRLLGAKGNGKYTYDENNCIQTDLVFIDESSMINSKLFLDLLLAIGKNTRLILCGDDKQLPPIGYGNVFSDCLSMKNELNTFKLTKVMRQAQKSGILTDANKIREGINPIKQPEVKIINGELKDMFYAFRDSREELQKMAVNIFIKTIQTEDINDVVILVPRKSNCINSANELNKIIQEKIVGNNEYLEYKNIKLYNNAKVMQVVNNYDKNIFNGEIGYVTKIINDYSCEVTYVQNNNIKIIEYTRDELFDLTLAYALTVHKAQGSGYKSVIGIVDNTHYSLLDSTLLYTLITRAKKRCLLLSEPQAFIKCIKNSKTQRNTWN